MRASCPICADVFDGADSILACPCGHVFHENCILRWVKESNTCPKCRSAVTARTVTKLFFNFPHETTDLEDIEKELSSLKPRIKANCRLVEKMENECAENRIIIKYMKEFEHIQAKLLELSAGLMDVLAKMVDGQRNRKQQPTLNQVKKAHVAIRDNMQHIQNQMQVISGTQEDVDNILQRVVKGPEALTKMAAYCSTLKKDLSRWKEVLQREIASLRKLIVHLNLTKTQSNKKIRQLRQRVSTLESMGLTKKKRRVKTLPKCMCCS